MFATVIILFFIFLFGLAVGSFLNVLIYRLPLGLPITGRSFCPKCKKLIRWYDNIPLLSFLNLWGKCRFCHSPISLRYPLLELVTGVLFLLTVVFYWGTLGIWGILGYLAIICALVVIFVIDLQHEIIPDALIIPSIPTALLISSYHNILISSLLSALGASLFFLLLYIVTRGRGMGLGDVKFVFLMGLILGFPKIILALYLAFLTGAICGVILILIGRKSFGQRLPFGPFLALATFFSLLWGEKIIKFINVWFF